MWALKFVIKQNPLNKILLFRVEDLIFSRRAFQDCICSPQCNILKNILALSVNKTNSPLYLSCNSAKNKIYILMKEL